MSAIQPSTARHGLIVSQTEFREVRHDLIEGDLGVLLNLHRGQHQVALDGAMVEEGVALCDDTHVPGTNITLILGAVWTPTMCTSTCEGL